jgi:pimeloyl-ACP methyl ester carboxylesterase
MSDRARRLVRLIIVLVLILVAMRLVPHAQRTASSEPAPAAHKRSAPQDLRLGTVTLKPCEIGRTGVAGIGTVNAFCTMISVPEDWGAPQGRHIELHVAVVKSGAPRPPSDLVTFLDGGPGGAATEDYPELAPAFAPLREKRNILLIDQRGTGKSNPLHCDAEKNSDNGAVKDLANRVQLVEQCLDRVRAFGAPEHYATSDATHDLEAVRQALGSPLLNLYGTSYGTRVAQQYAAHYAASVRSIVLDSTVPNELALGSDHARNLETALRQQFELCTKDARCQKNFGDTYQTLYRLRDHLREHPAVVTLRDPNSFEPAHVQMGAEDLAAIVRFYAYSPLTTALLPLMLHEADQGNYEPLLSQKKMLADSLGTEISGGMELSVICTEDADLLSSNPTDGATLMGSSTIERIKSACSIWPKGQRPADFHHPFASSLPVLILEGQYDPVTPPAYGEQVLRNLTHARLLVAQGQGHGVGAAGCMPKLVGEFVDDLEPLKINAGCLNALGDTPAFVDFNGAPP